jgi:hypothetical protein
VKKFIGSMFRLLGGGKSWQVLEEKSEHDLAALRCKVTLATESLLLG